MSQTDVGDRCRDREYADPSGGHDQSHTRCERRQLVRRRVTLTRFTAAICAVALGVAAAITLAQRGSDGAPPPVSAGIETAGATPGVVLVPVADQMLGALDVATPPGDAQTLYVVQQQGMIQAMERDGSNARTVLDLTDRVKSGGEQGLLGLAFHPDYAQNGLVYVHYTDRSGQVQISEFESNGKTIDASSERPLLSVPQPGDTHNGGRIDFGPDGLLYASIGDGGGIGAPRSRAQFNEDLLGTIIRIDPTPDGERPYTIPPDNPFVDDPASRPEIYAYGLRNPWRFSIDDQAGDLWIGDVGHDLVEEITATPLAEASGANFGWDSFEGTRTRLGPTSLIGDAWVRPTIQYSHDSGCSVTGGFVYRGSDIPALQGRYLFSDFCSGTVWSANAETKSDIRQEKELGPKLAGVTTFGEDAEGELYIVGAGTVYRFTAA